ncbi:MAG: signal peptidase II [Armatimonadota bacterium]
MRSTGTLWLGIVIVCTTITDQLTKAIARDYLEPGKLVGVLPGFLDLELVYNRGIAFGILPDWTPLVLIFGLGAIYALIRVIRTRQIRSVYLQTGIGLLLGGALGNLIDRFTSPTAAVTDFLSLHLTIGGKKLSWPTFNIADVGIIAGAAVVLLNAVFAAGSPAEQTKN